MEKTVKFFNNKHIPKEIFKRIQLERDPQPISLKVPVDTRWGTYAIMLNSLLKNKINLKVACVDKVLLKIVDKDIAKHVEDNTFWDKLERSVQLLNPILSAITQLEGDSPNLAIVNKAIKGISTSIGNVSDTFSVIEQQQICEFWENRKQFLYHPVQLAASYLDPGQHDKYLSVEEIEKVVEFIITYAKQKNLDETDVIIELAEYRCKTNNFSNMSYWNVSTNMPPVTWWKGFFPTRKLSIIATDLLTMPATTGSCERNFKLHSNIKAKKRNKLSLARTEKLVFIKHNLKFIFEDDYLNLKVNEDNLNLQTDDERLMSETDISDESEVEWVSSDSDGDKISDFQEVEESNDDMDERNDMVETNDMEERNNMVESVERNDMEERNDMVESVENNDMEERNDMDESNFDLPYEPSALLPGLKFLVNKDGKKVLILENYKLQ